MIWDLICDQALRSRHAIFEVPAAVLMTVLVFWDVMISSVVRRYQHFGGAYCLHLQTDSPANKFRNPYRKAGSCIQIYITTNQKPWVLYLLDKSHWQLNITACCFLSMAMSPVFYNIRHMSDVSFSQPWLSGLLLSGMWRLLGNRKVQTLRRNLSPKP